ncbi:hypothetical protein BCR32DRAFT_268259 [Anaeromyces robustus]|uniref:DnaJ-domain-containing protein n=1 Tax=Anaeromyces robustus TaxID=1754192 RepID=A0A1Y1X6V7_9FUNG|nr:hypothetical protein BCR32DRAFT_268259 [Anaeromyces robustus]|eukprot:ORX81517.1 hypothetical protein BCR32DRAFT_268259 [Anaeromyces robustus]
MITSTSDNNNNSNNKNKKMSYNYTNMNFYQLFGLNKNNFNETDLKKAYYRLSLQFHPDKNAKMSDMFKYINKAYEILNSSPKRKLYNEYGISAFNGTEIKEEYVKYVRPKSKSPPHKKLNDFEVSVFDDLNENSLFRYDESSEDLSSEVLNYSYLSTGVKFEEDKETIRVLPSDANNNNKIDVTLEELYLGAEKQFKIKRKIICPECFGNYQPYVVCDTCLGNGFSYNINLEQEVSCSACNGTGKKKINRDSKCYNCNGNVEIFETKTLVAHILPGMKHNEKIIFKGEGDQSLKSPPNDIIAIINVLPHPVFTCNGNDLTINVRISLKEALCGLRRRIKFLDGTYLSIMTNPGEVITPNSIKSYKNKGLVKNVGSKEKGNLNIRFFVQFPENNWTSLEDIKILESILNKSVSNMSLEDNSDIPINSSELIPKDQLLSKPKDYPSPSVSSSSIRSGGSNNSHRSANKKNVIDQFYQCDIIANGEKNPRTITIADPNTLGEDNPPRSISVIDSVIMPIPSESISNTSLNSYSDEYYKSEPEMRTPPSIRPFRRTISSDDENYNKKMIAPSRSVKSPKEFELAEKNKHVMSNSRNDFGSPKKFVPPPPIPSDDYIPPPPKDYVTPPLPPYPKGPRQLSHTRTSSLENNFFKNSPITIHSSQGKIYHSNTIGKRTSSNNPTPAYDFNRVSKTLDRVNYKRYNNNI